MTIYFIRKGNNLDAPIKIGYTASFANKRMLQLQTGHHEKLYLIGTIPGSLSDERAIHKELADYSIRGEWFHGKPELLETINDVIQNQRSWYYFRQVKYIRIDIECKGLRELAIELRKTIKTLEDENEEMKANFKEMKANFRVHVSRATEHLVARIGKLTARLKTVESKEIS